MGHCLSKRRRLKRPATNWNLENEDQLQSKYLLLFGGGDVDLHDDEQTACDVFSLEGQRVSNVFISNCPDSCGDRDGLTAKAVTMNNDVFIAGCGSAGRGLYKLEMANFSWSRCDDMLESAAQASVTAVGKNLVATGGSRNKVQVFNLDDCKWRYATDVPVTRISDAASVAQNGTIVLSGGEVSPAGHNSSTAANESSNFVWRLTLQEHSKVTRHKRDDSWEVMPTLVYRRSLHAMAVVKDAIYVIGGRDKASSESSVYPIEVLAQDSTTFITICLLPLEKQGPFSAIVEGNDILILPSYTGSGSEHDLRMMPAGDEPDDTMLIFHTAAEDVWLDTVKMHLYRPYPHGSQAVITSIPMKGVHTLHSVLCKLSYIKSSPADNSSSDDNTSPDGNSSPDGCAGPDGNSSPDGYTTPDGNASSDNNSRPDDNILQQVDELLSTHSENMTENDFKRFFGIVLGAIFLGSDCRLCLCVIESLIEKSLVQNANYSKAAEMMLDVRKHHFVLTAGETYLSLLKYFIGKNVTLKAKQVNELVVNESFLHLAACNPGLFQQMCTCLYAMVRKDKLSVIAQKLFSVYCNADPLLPKCNLLRSLDYLGVNTDDYDTCGQMQECLTLICNGACQNNHHSVHCNYSDRSYLHFCNNMTTYKPVKILQLSRDFYNPSQIVLNKITKLFEEISLCLPTQLQYSVKVAGSVAEGTKVGRPDEFDIQLELIGLSSSVTTVYIGYTGNARIFSDLGLQYENPEQFGVLLSESLKKIVQSLNWLVKPFFVKTVTHPWEVIWVEPGPCRGMHIFIDVVPIIVLDPQIVEVRFNRAKFNEYRPIEVVRRLGLIIQEPQTYDRPIKLMLKWGKPGGKPRWNCTISASERDIMDSLPAVVRKGYKLVKWLLEIDYWHRGAHYAHAAKPITSYMVKNAMFWLLFHDIRRGDCEKLRICVQHFENESQNIYSDADLGARDWACRILDYLKKETEEGLALKSFFISNIFLYSSCHLPSIRQTCEKLLCYINSQ